MNQNIYILPLTNNIIEDAKVNRPRETGRLIPNVDGIGIVASREADGDIKETSHFWESLKNENYHL